MTIATFRAAFGKNQTVGQLRQMTEQQWDYIFKHMFWDTWNADNIDSQSIADILVDWLWASGNTAIRNTQKMLGLKTDGIAGPVTIAAINARQPEQLFKKLQNLRLDFIDRICRARPKNEKFRRGWVNRIRALQYLTPDDTVTAHNHTPATGSI